MLCITLRDDETFKVHHGGEVLVIKVRDHRANTRIYFDGPRSFDIVRDEATCKRPPGRPEPDRAA